MVGQDQTLVSEHCDHCEMETLHESRCTGGIKLKPYITSYDGRDWTGDMKHLGVSAEYADGSPVRERDGSRTDSVMQSSFENRIGEKRDRCLSRHRRRTGGSALFFDQRSGKNV